MSNIKCIVVTLQIEALHSWPDAGKHYPLVAYLEHPHRHMFHIKAVAKVNHNERDIEIILFKKELVDYFKRNYWDAHLETHNFGARSCETIAEGLLEAYDLIHVEVLEDGENGALLYSDKAIKMFYKQ